MAKVKNADVVFGKMAQDIYANHPNLKNKFINIARQDGIKTRHGAMASANDKAKMKQTLNQPNYKNRRFFQSSKSGQLYPLSFKRANYIHYSVYGKQPQRQSANDKIYASAIKAIYQKPQADRSKFFKQANKLGINTRQHVAQETQNPDVKKWLSSKKMQNKRYVQFSHGRAYPLSFKRANSMYMLATGKSAPVPDYIKKSQAQTKNFSNKPVTNTDTSLSQTEQAIYKQPSQDLHKCFGKAMKNHGISTRKSAYFRTRKQLRSAQGPQRAEVANTIHQLSNGKSKFVTVQNGNARPTNEKDYQGVIDELKQDANEHLKHQSISVQNQYHNDRARDEVNKQAEEDKQAQQAADNAVKPSDKANQQQNQQNNDISNDDIPF